MTEFSELTGPINRPSGRPVHLQRRGRERYPVVIPAGEVRLDGDLAVPPGAKGVVVWVEGNGRRRERSPHGVAVRTLQAAGLGTLRLGLLTQVEEREQEGSGRDGLDLELLARRLVDTTRWLKNQPEVGALGVGLFGAGTEGAVALVAAAKLGELVQAVVSQAGRPDLAGPALDRVAAPTLLIVGRDDGPLVKLNRAASHQLTCVRHLAIVPGGTPEVADHGAREAVVQLAGEWFTRHLHANGRA